ncbi:hypothetical protein ACHAXA_009275 [Cyclostephanos tholiformis]|uniref:Site-specific DNA-methyltransferase (adenine-specific) n=1 Tax=Cyclostephanos tholiformis TaxID=382380 RepID=A0ABD3RTJ2_9STRA
MIAGETRPNPANKRNKKDKRKRRRPSGRDDDGGVESRSTTSIENCPTVANDDMGTTIIRSNGRVRFGDFPYPTDYNDHFETPARAYEDIFPLLEYILAGWGKDDAGKITTDTTIAGPQGRHGCENEAIIYDPYYCAGRAASLLDDVFRRNEPHPRIRIQHEKRDFYRDIEQNTVPRYDILVTNPPYSGNHKERCLDFAVGQLRRYARPFFLLMPNYVAMKEYFRRTVLEGSTGPKKGLHTFYIAPSPDNPYEYDHPDGTGHQVPPFNSVWFCGLACKVVGTAQNKSVIDAFIRFHSTRDPSRRGGKPRIVSSLQELINVGGVSGERRKNPRQRRRMRMQQAASLGSHRDAAAVGKSVEVNAGNTLGTRLTNKKKKIGK